MRALVMVALCGCTSILGISDPKPGSIQDGGPDMMIDSNIDAPPPCTTASSLKPETALDLGKPGFDFVIGRFDNGTTNDVAVAAGDEVLIFHGDTGNPGTFGADGMKIQVPSAATGIAMEDYDGVGFDDLALWSDNGTAVNVLIQNRALNPPFNAPAALSGTFTSVKNVIAEQLDGNLRADLIVYDSGANSRVYTSNAGGSFSMTTETVGTGTDELVLMKQIDGAQRSDAIFITGTSVKLALQLNNNTFQGLNTIAMPIASKGFAVGKFDGDALPDVIISTTQGLKLFRQNSAQPGSFTDAGIVSPLVSAAKINVVDLNGDGRDDLVLANAAILQCAPAMANGPGVFTQVEAISAGNSKFIDITGDGKADLLRLEGNSLKVRIQ